MGSTNSKPSKNNDSKQGFNLDIWSSGSKILESIILDYSFEAKRLENPLTQFWTSSLKQEILAFAYHAAPLDQVETCIKKAYARKEKHLCDTLVEATTEAIKNGDVTLKDEKGNVLKDAIGNVIAEGMAERLIKLHDELYSKETKCIDKVRPMLLVEDEEEKRAREEANVAAVNQVFEAIMRNDQNTNTAIKNFKAFVESTTALNRIHLLFVAFAVLARRGNNLPKIKYKDCRGTCGLLADRFYFEVIGAGIEINLPPRMQQLLKTGLYTNLSREVVSRVAFPRAVERKLDVDGLSFRGVPGSNTELGVHAYYDDIGRGKNLADRYRSSSIRTARNFQYLYERLQEYSPCLLLEQPNKILSMRKS